MTLQAAREDAAKEAAALAEERDRAAARTDDRALVAYEAKWARKLRKLQRSHPERWQVPGLSQEEVRDLLTLRLIESVRGDRPAPSMRRSAGKEWGLLLAEQELQSLRKKFRLRAVPIDFRASPPPARHAPSHEELWLDAEAEAIRATARRRAEQGLNRSQRRWLAALARSAEAGTFFKTSAEPNLSAASRLLGRDRSSAQRAYRQLQRRFGAELRRPSKA
jgi:hypothetical protein